MRNGLRRRVQGRRQLSTWFICCFLWTCGILAATSLLVPGLLNPGAPSRIAVVAISTGLLGAASVIWCVGGASPRYEKVLVYAVAIIIAIAMHLVRDRAGARLVTVMYALDLLFASLYLGVVDMVVLLLVAAGATVWVMRSAGDSWALTAFHSAVVLVGTTGPCIMVGALRAQLSGALDRALHQASTDPLTGLANRHGMQERAPALLSRANRAGEPVGMLLVDIDHFKVVNDTYGHQVGDEVLRDVASAIRSCVRGDDLVVRLGGEEIGVLTAQAAPVLVALGERIRMAVARDCAVTVSVGVAWSLPAPGAAAREFLGDLAEVADTYLYAAKNAGRNQVHAPALTP